MAEKSKKPIRRTRPRYDFGQYTAQPDAVNQTLRVNGLAPELMLVKRQIIELQIQAKQLQEAATAQRRKAYRQRRMQLAPLSAPLSDEQVDLAMAMEDYQRLHQAYISQGYDRPKINTDRMADQYANVSNFYAALGSPNMMPMNDLQVRANPQMASAQLDFGLNNPALTALQIAAPTGPGTGVLGAGKLAATQAFKGAGNFASRTGLAMWQGTKAVGQTTMKNAPRVVGTAAVNAIPMGAMAAEFLDDPQQGGGEGGGSAMPWVIGGATALIGGKWLYGRYKAGKGIQSATNLTSPKYLALWERNPNAVAADAKFAGYKNRYNTAFLAGDLATLDAMKTEFGKSPNAKITLGKGKKATQVDNPDFLSNTDLGTMIQNRAYPTTEGLLIYTKGQNFWRNARNTGRLGIYGGVGGLFGMNMFGGGDEPTQQPMLPTAEQFGQNYLEVDSSLNDTQITPSDTVVAIPRDSVPSTPVNTFKWNTRQ